MATHMPSVADEKLNHDGCPVLDPSKHSYKFEIKDQVGWDLYKGTSVQVWNAQEIDYSNDRDHWENKLTTKEREYMIMILAFFANIDAIVMRNCSTNFASEVHNMEALHYYGYQTHIENVHAETYAELIKCVIRDRQEQEKLLDALNHYPVVAKMAAWAEKWMNPSIPYRFRLVAFICYEAILFSDKFAAIFWMRDRNLLEAVGHANLLIAKDEGSHEQFGIHQHGLLKHKCTPDEIAGIVKEAVTLDEEFIRAITPEGMINMNVDMMLNYTKIVANRVLSNLCGKTSKVPFQYDVTFDDKICSIMDKLGLMQMTSFFEKRGSNYNSMGIDKFSIDAEF